ncbi:pre-peptidase C-terminal domain-containing protein [Azospirillum sp.]|uniref:pre-peptidase C-terminal domain-containing protein n=1 Tax=Azospirillum sp. TaxID=34012 RepID=UPI002D2A5A61|nr:pre-peptidase C-terminal domain-containing protein [Azospirillum sp.]HYD64539.1 pre-peptidase C-terminal domain-containing protein [Azospirillum sp.]
MTTSVGTTGADSLVGSAADDILSGLDGNDTFVITATSGTIYVDDVEGADTINASGASGAVTVNLAPGGATSQINGASVSLSRPASGSKTDVFLLEDLSGSFSDDLSTVATLLPTLESAVVATGADVAYGLGTFVDKPVYPFGGGDDYSYRTELAMTNAATLKSTIEGLSVLWGGDLPESQIEALFQVAKRAVTNPAEIGFREGALRTVVLSTDATFHIAGDGMGAGLAAANNGDAVVDGGEDYPTVAQLRTALEAANIVPIFAVTDDAMSSYQTLVSDLGRGVVVELEGDSSNLTTAILSGLTAARTSLIENAIGGTGGDTLTGNGLVNSLTGGAGDDTLENGPSLVGGNGDDFFDGGAGIDTAVFNGNQNEYVVSRVNATTVTVLDTMSGRDGLDTVVNAETLRFADTTLSIAPSAPPPPVVTPEDNAGDTVATATDLGLLETKGDSARSTAEFVDSKDVDYYRFAVQTRSNLTITLDGMSADADVSLRSALDRVIASSAVRGDDAEHINRVLAAGTYYLKIAGYKGAATPYQLSLNAAAWDSDSAGPIDMGTLTAAVQSVTDHVGAGDTDTFIFSTYATGNVAIGLKEMTADADVALYNVKADGTKGTLIRRSNSAGTAADTVKQNSLKAGTYMVEVAPDRGADTDYTLTLQTTVRDGAGNTKEAAKNLGNLSTKAFTENEAVGNSDQFDFYKFSTKNRSTVNVGLSNMIGDADVVLLDSTGSEIATSVATGAAGEGLTELLGAGTYFLKVADRGLDTSYTLNLASVPTDTVGDTLGKAKDMGTLRTGATLSSPASEIVVGDDIDIYKFAVATNGSELTFVMTGMTADADLALLDGKGTVIQASSANGTAEERFTYEANRGTYYLQVSGNGGAQTGYRATVSAAALDSAGETIETATALGTLLPRTVEFNDTLSRTDVDIYKFVVGSEADVTATLGDTTTDTRSTYAFLDASGEVIESSNFSSRTMTSHMSPGTYYMKLTGNLGESSYAMTLNALPSDNAGDTQEEAASLGNLRRASSELSTQDFVGTATTSARDADDWYRVGIDSETPLDFTVSLSELSARASIDVSLVEVDGSILTTRRLGATGGTVAEEDLGAGLYYIHVQSRGADTNYALTVTGGGTASAARSRPSFTDTASLSMPLSSGLASALSGMEPRTSWQGILAA